MLLIRIGDPSRQGMAMMFEHHLNQIEFDFKKKKRTESVRFGRVKEPTLGGGGYSVSFNSVSELGHDSIDFFVGSTIRGMYLRGPFKRRGSVDMDYFFQIQVVSGSTMKNSCYVEISEEEYLRLIDKIYEKWIAHEKYVEDYHKDMIEKQRVKDWEEDQKVLEFLKEEVKKVFGTENVA